MWRLIKLQLQLAVVTLLGFFALPFLPVSMDFEPVAYNVSLPAFEGPLKQNLVLDSGKMLFQQKLLGPESFAVKDGIIYTATKYGGVFAVDPVKETITKVADTGSDCAGSFEEEKCGRVLGLRFAPNGDLYGVDAYKGLVKIDIRTGKVEILVANGQYVGNSRLLFGDDLDFDEDGVIYFSQASRRWGLQQIMWLVLEHDTTGRILTYDPKTKKSGVLVDGLGFPNGVQMSVDKQSLLFTEINKKRVMKYQLKGADKGKLSVFADQMPGGPDNIRSTVRGTYWVAIDFARSDKTPFITEFIAPYPLLSKAFARFCFVTGQALKAIGQYVDHPVLREWADQVENGKFLVHVVPKRGVVVELDQSGKILRSLHSSHYTLISEVLELNGHIYLGSFINPYLLRVKFSP